MAEKAETTKVQIPLNKELLDHAVAVREQWGLIVDRLQKIEESKPQVSDVVYRRVRMDYEQRREEAKKGLLETKGAIDQELASLTTTKQKIEKELENHKNAFDEINFRHSLGEFEAGDFTQRVGEVQEKITKFETIIAAVNENIQKYEAVFEGIEETSFVSQEIADTSEEDERPLTTDTDLPISQMISRGTEPVTDESGYIIEEEGPHYFSGVAETTNPHLQDTAKTQKTKSSDSSKKHSRILFVDGTDAGAIFGLNGLASLGRAESNTIMVKDAKASRQHCQIVQKGSEYVLVDLNSSNGTFVNGERVEEHVLSNGDEIQIGDTHLQFQG
ncbi:MAG: hypothetical protein A3I05_07695 [Deltaproteobacteria bacterium RIFCSPLOWO2_02_FULL_44_10]|nr:MAG: hypothetical protein A3C46_09530 [Deltaproteobacteria bacterium RIFCSPHIGHO2_02_FULL_44_16]OGQ46763.1 MAG: hypothetical protein A3I05_07695 [Deltaproteobacteria bacterium RIFCSPLOWO2_02_FULL_44_10]